MKPSSPCKGCPALRNLINGAWCPAVGQYVEHVTTIKCNKTMKARKFFDLVVEMRRLQREYFKTKDSVILQKSKAVETEIDKEIERVLNIVGKEGGAA